MILRLDSATLVAALMTVGLAGSASAHPSYAPPPADVIGSTEPSGQVPLAGRGYFGPAARELVGAGMSVPSQDKAFFGGGRTTCPPRGQSNDFSRQNPAVCDNY